MKQFFTVFKFEFGQKLREKSFIITLILTFLIVFGLTFLPRLMGSEGGPEPNVQTSKEVTISEADKDTVGVLYSPGVDSSVDEALKAYYNMEEFTSEEDLKEAVLAEEVDRGFLILDNTNAKVYLAQASLSQLNDVELQEILRDNYKYNIALRGTDLDGDALRQIDATQVSTSVESLGPNPFTGFVLSYVLLFFLYFVILMNGQSISTSVAREKDNRTMELLVTNVKSNAMIWGKVMSGFAASILQILVLALALWLGYMVNYGSNPLANELVSLLISEINFMDIAIFLGFALVGIVLYYLLFAALGSLVSRLDEMNQALTPVIFIVIIAFMIPMTTMSMGENIVLTVASYIPFTSPLSMFVRYQVSSVPLWEVGLSFAILVVTTVIVGIAASKIYRNGTLSYGNRLNLWKALTSKSE